MRFNPQHWSVISHGQEVEAESGIVHVRSTAQFALFITDKAGVEALAGLGNDIKVRTQGAATYRVEVNDDGAAVYAYRPQNPVIKPMGEVFTNLDRMPMESGAYNEVTQALRLFQLEQRQLLGDLRRERDELRRVKAREESQDDPDENTDEVAEPEPEGEPDAAPTE